MHLSSMNSVAAAWTGKTARGSGVPAQEVVRRGQTREGRALDLGLPEGVAAEEERRMLGGREERIGVGVRYPAVAPPGEGRADDRGRQIGAQALSREGDELAGYPYLVV